MGWWEREGKKEEWMKAVKRMQLLTRHFKVMAPVS